MGQLKGQNMTPGQFQSQLELIPGNGHQTERTKPILNKTLTSNTPPQPPQTGEKNGRRPVGWKSIRTGSRCGQVEIGIGALPASSKSMDCPCSQSAVVALTQVSHSNAMKGTWPRHHVNGHHLMFVRPMTGPQANPNLRHLNQAFLKL